jgi:hypothetical protein
MKKREVLEPSSNTHVMEANFVKLNDLGEGVMSLEIKGKGIVSHGEHGTIATESKFVVKDLQQEFNPITKMLQNAYD